MNYTIAFLGCGNMGSAIVSALLEKEIVSPEMMRICDKNPEKLKMFSEKGVHVSQVPEEVIAKANIVFLAVKPQDARNLLRMLNGSFQESALLVSIAAGLSVKFLQQNSGIKKIVRVMPNTPAMVCLGISGMHAIPDVSEDEKTYVTNLLESFSTVINCKDEEQIDAITALSSNGPAYFFRFLEIISEKAEEFGFSKKDANCIALNTLRGAGRLAKSSNEDFSLLRKKVTSKGGTTEASLKVFHEKNLKGLLKSAIEAGFKRAKELSE